MRRRILLTMMALTSVAVLALLVPAAVALRQAGQRRDLLDVQRDASVVASRIPPAGSIDIEALASGLGPNRRLGIYSGNGRLIDGHGPASPDPILAVGLTGHFAEGEVGGDLVAVVPARIDAAGRPALVVRIEEGGESSRNRTIAAIAVLGALAIGIIGLAGVAGSYLAARLHRPIEALRRWAETDPTDDLSPPDPTGIGELDSLRSTLVDGRQRVAELLRRERLFSSRVSHQLRTPVAAIRVALEAELDTPRTDRAAILWESLGALDLLESTITSLLALGRNAKQPNVATELLALLTRRVEPWRPRFGDIGRSVCCQGEEVMLEINPPAIEHIVDVLLENALHHGSGGVTVTLTDQGDTVWLEVADEGSIPEGADPLADPHAGADHGIGLGLARSLAESVGGGLELVGSRPTTFRLTLPKSKPSIDTTLTLR